ncbi:type I restriction endonuclease subunit R [Salinicoccus luteus]|uniref:type I restriction endonuclease subunit R n=1 Tax=Salinicoccus luteus TaxID=367840 RepID=UPI0004E130FC|nr:type I restriction endonuclease subunit R [Salinicoccus luteus]
MSYEREDTLEAKVMKRLEGIGYERVPIRSNEALEQNFRDILNRRHAKLKAEPLSDKEFSRLMTQINNKSVFDSAKILRDKFVLKRDDETELYLEFFDQKNYARNSFQVTNQISVEDRFKGRYDVTVLINGLPVVQLELKRRGVAINEAFNQVKRYRRDNYTGLFRYTQLFLLSNYNDTRYFANGDKEIMKSHMFYWTDEENNRITNLDAFIGSFMAPTHLAKMISRYMIVNEPDKNLIVMRPYQVYATEALINRALNTDRNGFVWHTTGSGKTLTSFKASQLLAQEPDIKKVIFLVDRKDLDTQTQKEFTKFEPDSVDHTDNTKHLLRQLGDKSKPMIITTIQKMTNAIKSNHPVMDDYRTDKVVFVIDECHRSQFGDMHMEIRKHFKNAQYFGFTGTPRFKENRSQDGRSTADIFDTCLHSYLIKDAIRDGNVLGFSVEYISTINDELKVMDEQYVSKIDTDEIWMADKRIELVTRHIHQIHDRKTKDREYVAIFATQSIDMAMKYYDMFQKVNEEAERPLNVATIFTYQTNQDMKDGDTKEAAKHQLDRVLGDYNRQFGTNFSIDTYGSYFEDVSKRIKGEKAVEQIDILIVVNMFLTGFDSRKLNTLYVDKNLKHHDLIQAYSRTNRVEKQKKSFGNIVVYRNLKKATDDAIQLFSKTDSTDTVLSKSYEEYLDEFKKALDEMHAIAPNPGDVQVLEDETIIKSFILAFRALGRALVKLKTFEAFEFTREEIGMSEQDYEDYKGQYVDLYERYVRGESEGEKVSVINDIDFEIELIRNDKINVHYIRMLLRNIDLEDKKQQAQERKNIKMLLDRADDEQLRLKADLIREFLDKVVPTLDKDANIDKVYLDFEEDKQNEVLKEFSEEMDMQHGKLLQFLTEYQFSGQLYRKDISKELSGPFMKRKKKVDKVIDFIKKTTRKFGFAE